MDIPAQIDFHGRGKQDRAISRSAARREIESAAVGGDELALSLRGVDAGCT
jgi:hypothetical protein